MPEEIEKEINNFTGSNCVIHDDDHGWGGPEPEKKPEKIPEIPEPNTRKNTK